MTTEILEHHGGICPHEGHIRSLPDEINKVTIFYTCNDLSNIVIFTHSLLYHKVKHVYCIMEGIHGKDEVGSVLHPIITFLPSTTDIHEFIENNLIDEKRPHLFWIKTEEIIHPHFWGILEEANKGYNYIMKDSKNNNKLTLYSHDKKGVSANSYEVNRIAAYNDMSAEKDTIHELVSNDIQRIASMELAEITMDVSTTFTPLCHIGSKYMTDKSPYNLVHHRHPYTAIYDMFLRKYRKKQSVKLGEIGILGGSSLRMWREYLPTAIIHAFDINEESIKQISDINRIHVHKMDSSNVNYLKTSLLHSVSDGKKFDILIEDASHCLNHQLLFLRYCLDYVESGGIVIIEDIFRAIPSNRFQEIYRMLYDKLEHAILVKPEHTYRHSPDWENDRLLILWRT